MSVSQNLVFQTFKIVQYSPTHFSKSVVIFLNGSLQDHEKCLCIHFNYALTISLMYWWVYLIPHLITFRHGVCNWDAGGRMTNANMYG